MSSFTDISLREKMLIVKKKGSWEKPFMAWRPHQSDENAYRHQPAFSEKEVRALFKEFKDFAMRIM